MRLLPRNLGLLAVSLALACLLWYANARDRRERISERQLEAAVTLVNVPAEMVITSEVPRSLTLRVRGPLNRLRELTPEQVGVVIDLRTASEGEAEVAVETPSVIVPANVEVQAVVPSQVPLRLERIIRRKLPIKPRVTGEPAATVSIIGVVADPGAAVVSGPKGQLEKLPFVATDPVSVDGADGPVEVLVAVRSPHPLVRIIEPLAVRVVVSLATRIEPRAGRGT